MVHPSYDIVIKLRADIVFFEELLLPEVIEKNTIYIPEGNDYPYHSYDPFYHVEGINDHLAYGTFETMKVYSNVYKNIDNYCSNGRPYHPESLLLHHLQSNGLKIKRFRISYILFHDRFLSTDTFYHPESS